MHDGRPAAHRPSVRIASCGMTAALSIVVMLMGGLIPVATYAIPMVCGLLLLPLLLEFDAKAAWTTYLAVALISLILGLDKEAAFFYLFIGYYPIVKWRLDRLRPRLKRAAVKILLFTAAFAAMYGLLALFLPVEAVLGEFREAGLWMTLVFVLLYEACMLIYDWMLLPLTVIYVRRIRPRLKFLWR